MKVGSAGSVYDVQKLQSEFRSPFLPQDPYPANLTITSPFNISSMTGDSQTLEEVGTDRCEIFLLWVPRRVVDKTDPHNVSTTPILPVSLRFDLFLLSTV